MAQETPKAANTNQPLWQRLALAVADDSALLQRLSVENRTVLWEKALEIMKPDAAEQQAMAHDEAAQNSYMLEFARAYRSGTPPYSDYVSRLTTQAPE